MQNNLRHQLSHFTRMLQQQLFPMLQDSLGEPLSDTARQFIAVLALIPLRRFVPCSKGWNGRPSKDRYAIGCAFVAKAVYGLSTTRQLIDWLQTDQQLRRLCGWEAVEELPHESTFSRAFAEFAQMELPQFVHEALIRETQKDRLIGHIARDSTAIEARERFASKTDETAELNRVKIAKQNRGCLPQDALRLDRQLFMGVADMLSEIPKTCNIGAKRDAAGNPRYWRGYKLHLDIADGEIPITALVTSASVHDSQLAIPMAEITATRVTSLYDLMDTAYIAPQIAEHSRSLGHVPIIAPRRKANKTQNIIVQPKQPRQMTWAEQDRYRERSMAERVNARLKDTFGCRQIFVRGHAKVTAHLMFAVVALTADQILRLIRP